MFRGDSFREFRRAFLPYAIIGFLCFSAGYFIHFGREAHASGSWNYTLGPVDNLFYWSCAKGRMTVPRSDGNPFYFEQIGLRNAVPYTAAEVVGLISKYTKIPLEFFFPIWHILMPFFAWGVLVWCLWRFWKYSLEASMLVSALLFCATLFCASEWTLCFTRFSRPLDGLPWLYLWISLIFYGDGRNKWHALMLAGSVCCALWLHPFYAAFGFWITGWEILGCLLKGKEARTRLRFLCFSLLVGCIAGLGYYFLTSRGSDINRAILDYINSFQNQFPFMLLAMGWAVFFLIALLFFRFFFKRTPTVLDRAILEGAFFGVFMMGVQVFVLRNGQFADHLFYFSMINILISAGWVCEKLRWLKEDKKQVVADILFAGMTLLYGLVLALTKINFFRDDFPMPMKHYFMIYSVWFYYLVLAFFVYWRFKGFFLGLGRFKKSLVAGIVGLALMGFWQYPLNPANKEYPFVRAHQWLKENARANDVVLSLAMKYLRMDYLFLRTGLKSYYSTYGDAFAGKGEKEALRPYLFVALLTGTLDEIPFLQNVSLRDKLHLYKLDYILTEQTSLFLPFVRNELRGFLKEVYRDEKCLIFQVL